MIFTATDPKKLRVGINSFLDSLALVVETIEQFGPPSWQIDRWKFRFKNDIIYYQAVFFYFESSFLSITNLPVYTLHEYINEG